MIVARTRWSARLVMAALSLCLIGSGMVHASASASSTPNTVLEAVPYQSPFALAVDSHGVVYIVCPRPR